MRKKTTSKKKSWLRPPTRPKRELEERGVGAIAAAFIMTGVMLGITLIVAMVIAQVLPIITEALSGGLHLGTMLVHVPEMQGTFWGGSFSVDNIASDNVQYVFIAKTSEVMGSLYGTIMTISFAVLLIAFVLVGLFYALEQFRVVGEGTASTILSESVFVIILIFIFPLLFNGVAAMINGIDEGIIMHHVDDAGNVTNYEKMVNSIAYDAGKPPGLLTPIDTSKNPFVGLIGNVPNEMSKAITVLVTASVSLIAIFTAFATGIFKVLAIAVFAAAFPLILVLRLIPFTRSVSTRLTGAFIGLLLASIVISLFFRVGWGILEAIPETEAVMVWGLGCGILIAVTATFTITAPALSGMAAAIGHTVGRGVAAPTAGLIAGGVTTGLAMVPAGGMAAGMAARSGEGLRGTLGATVRAMGAGARAGGPAKEPFGAFSAGVGVARMGGTERYLAGRMGAVGNLRKNVDAQMTQGTIHLEKAKRGLTRGELNEQAIEGQKLYEDFDKMGGDEHLDMHGRKIMGPKYDPAIHRKILVAGGMTPEEAKEANKLSYAKRVQAGDQTGAKLEVRLAHDGKVVRLPKTSKFGRGEKILAFPTERDYVKAK